MATIDLNDYDVESPAAPQGVDTNQFEIDPPPSRPGGTLRKPGVFSAQNIRETFQDMPRAFTPKSVDELESWSPLNSVPRLNANDPKDRQKILNIFSAVGQGPQIGMPGLYQPPPQIKDTGKPTGADYLGAAAVNHILDTAGFFTSLKGGATAAGFGMVSKVPWLFRLVSSMFATKMGKDAASDAKDVYAEFQKPEEQRDYGKIADKSLSAGENVFYGALGAYGAAKPGIAREIPSIEKWLTTSITEKYSGPELRAIYDRVNAGGGTQQEQDLVKFINRQVESPRVAIRQGVEVTSRQPKIQSEFWQKYLGLEPESRTVSVLPGQAPAAQPPPAAPTAPQQPFQPTGRTLRRGRLLTEGGSYAPTQRQVQESAQGEYPGVSQGQNVPQDNAEVREEDSGQAVGGGGVQPTAPVVPVVQGPELQHQLTGAGAEEAAKELGLTIKPVTKAAAITIPEDISRYSPEDQAKLKALLASQKPTREVTDRRKGSPTEGLTINPTLDMSKADVIKMWDAARAGYTPIEQKAKPTGQVIPGETLTAATYTDKNGKEYDDENHIAAAEQAGVKAPKSRIGRETPEYGFRTSTGRKVDRKEGLEIASRAKQLAEGVTPMKVARGNLHSDQVDFTKPQEAAKPAEPEKAKPRKRYFIGPRSDGNVDILDDIQELGGIRPPRADDTGGEYDGWEDGMKGTARLLINRASKHTPDTIIGELASKGYELQDADHLFREIQSAVASREQLRTKGGTAEDRAARFWEAATAPKSKLGLKKINVQDLKREDKFYLKGPGISTEQFEVIKVDTDNQVVTVKDGPTIGVQDIPDGTEIWVQKKGLEMAGEQETEWPDVQPEPQAAPPEPKFKAGDSVIAGEGPFAREGTIAASGPYKDGKHSYFVRTNLGETLYQEDQLHPKSAEVPQPAGAPPEAPPPAPKKPSGQLFDEGDMPFNLVGEKQPPPPEPKAKPPQNDSQDMLLKVSTTVATGDVQKSAAAAAEMYGGPADAAKTLKRQLEVIDADPESRKSFSPEQRARLKMVINALEEQAMQAKPPEPPIQNPEPIKAESSRRAEMVTGTWEDIKASNPDVMLAIASAKNHFTLWWKRSIPNRISRFHYIGILGNVKEDAINRAIESAKRIAAGDLTGIAFVGPDVIGTGEIKKVGLVTDVTGPDQLDELLPGEIIAIGQQNVGFGRYSTVPVKEMLDKDPGWVEWLVSAANSKRALQLRDYFLSLPEYAARKDAQASASRDAVSPETENLLKAFGLTATPNIDGTITVGGKTYDFKETIKQFGGRFRGDEQAWRLPADGFKQFAAKLGGLPKPDSGSGRGIAAYSTDPKLEELRRAAEQRPDNSGFTDPVERYCGPETQELLNRGKKIGMPQMVLNEQIEDVARINRAYQQNKPVFLLASEPGSGKTFVLGGAIREMQRAGAKNIVYVTLRQELITQIQNDLKDYGIEAVRFITYPKMRTDVIQPTDVLIFDEAHSIKNVAKGDETVQQAEQAAKWIRKSKFTILASATPFENPIQAEYLEPTGIFKDPFGTFDNFAMAFGASRMTLKSGDQLIIWKRTSTSDVDQAAARQFFIKEGVYTSRRIRLPEDQVDSRLVKVQAEESIAKMYQAFSEAAAQHENFLVGFAKPWVTNFQKRILESSKVKRGIIEAENAVKRGRYPIIFVETKAERKIDIPHLIDKEAEWQRDANFALANRDRPPPRKNYGLPPKGIVEVLSTFMDNTGTSMITIPSAEDLILNHFGADNVAVFTGSVTPKKAQENLDTWRAGKEKKVLVATIAKGGTGLSLHDKVGNHPTTQTIINLPWTATQVVQVAQRSARYGLAGLAEIQWIFADNIPFDAMLANRVGGRMADMGAVVHGERLKGSAQIEDWDFEDKLFSETGQAVKESNPGAKGYYDIYSEPIGLGRPSGAPTVEDVRRQRRQEAPKLNLADYGLQAWSDVNMQSGLHFEEVYEDYLSKNPELQASKVTRDEFMRTVICTPALAIPKQRMKAMR